MLITILYFVSMVDRNIFIVEALDEAGNKDVSYKGSIDEKALRSIKSERRKRVGLDTGQTKEMKISEFFSSTEEFFPKLRLSK